jgi:hypothetical protein
MGEEKREDRIDYLNSLHGFPSNSRTIKEAIDDPYLDREVAELIKLHGPDVECVLMGPMGQADVMAAHEILGYAEEHYDRFDYAELHADTFDEYVAEYERQLGVSWNS